MSFKASRDASGSPPRTIRSVFVYASLSDTNDAIAMLEKAFEEKDVRMVFLKVDKRWEPLRQDPRFVELMRRMNFT